MKKSIYIILMLIVFITSCQQGNIEWNNKVKIPAADIVYQTIQINDEETGLGKEMLGFYSLETREIYYVDWNLHLIKPYYLSDNTIIAINKQGNYGSLQDFPGHITIISNEHIIECDGVETYGGLIYPYQGNILLYGESGINLINSSDCSVMKSILKYDGLTSYRLNAHTGPSSLSNDGKFLVISSDLELLRVNLTDMSVYNYGVTGTNPSLSPDGTKITYLSYDGFHLLDYDGKNDILLVEYHVAESIKDDYYDRGYLPMPNWSRDGNKLIYHKCIRNINQSCLKIEDNAIFIFDLLTKTETQVIDSGIYPSWR